MSTKISAIEESMSNNMSELEETVTSVKDSIADMKEQIESEAEQFMKIQPNQISEEIVLMIKTQKTLEKVTLPVVGVCLLYTSRCV